MTPQQTLAQKLPSELPADSVRPPPPPLPPAKKATDTGDFRDVAGDPMEKKHPDPNHWSREDRPERGYVPGKS